MKRGEVSNKIQEASIRAVVAYFDLFGYAASSSQIHTFLSVKLSIKECEARLHSLVRKGVLVTSDVQLGKHMPPESIYAMGGHSIFMKRRIVRKAQTEKKINKLKTYSKILSLSPWIRLVGISGSCSMENAKAGDDVDFFIITVKNRLWLARAWAITSAKLLGVHRSRKDRRVSGKACLNMFFDEQDMCVPAIKQNLYTAHEVVQMHCLDMREGAYYQRLFLQSNRWISSYFPNIRMPKMAKDISAHSVDNLPILGILGDLLEHIVKVVQKSIMSGHITHETITNTQLWFFPKDFSKKIVKKVY